MNSINRFYLIALGIIIFSQYLLSQQLVLKFSEANRDGSNYGNSISCAADINNDGFSDIIVADNEYNNSQGRVYVYYGGSLMNTEADIIITGEGTGNSFGCSVSGAGDVNNDGFDDIIIGADKYYNFVGRAYLYYGGNNMDNIADLILTGVGSPNYFGCSVAIAGDVNNDGFDDVIVGDENYSISKGQTYIYYGGNNMDNIADITLTGASNFLHFGCYVSGAGDVNNDGYSDVIVQSNEVYNNISRAYIYYGGSNIDTVADVIITGAGDWYAYSVSKAGDLNNDEFDDIIVGISNVSFGRGEALIYYGSTNMDNQADAIILGKVNNSFLGNFVSGVGDVNSDGYDDLAIGSYDSTYFYYGNSTNEFVEDVIINVSGLISGFGDLNNDNYDDVVISASSIEANVYYGSSNFNGIKDLVLEGEGTNNYFGGSVSGVGDLNNDGYNDFIVAAKNYNLNTGRVYVYHGGSPIDSTADVVLTGETPGKYFGYSVSGANDINNDGYNDLIIGSQNNKVYIYYGDQVMDTVVDKILNGDGYFGYSVSDAGDVNNDAFDDIIIGAVLNSTAYIYFGGANISSTPALIIAGAVSTSLGGDVESAGDVNNDGYSDVIIGASAYNSSMGRAYLYFGGNIMNNLPDLIFTGEPTNDNFGRADGAGDLNNDGYDDIVIGAPFYSASRGKAFIYLGGSAMDTIPDITMIGKGPLYNLGYSVSSAGDINNDGYDDVLIAAAGREVYVYYGGDIMDNIEDITMEGIFTTGVLDDFGYSISAAGDLNNDGFDDLLIGAPKSPVNGEVYIFSDDLAPMPVEMISFIANINFGNVHLTWETASELNNSGFEIERKSSHSAYKNIGFITGNGTTNETQTYNFIDKNVLNDIYTYRLKQINFDGSFSYSDEISISVEIPKVFSLSQNYPNPFNSASVIKYSIPKSSQVLIKIFNTIGEEIETLVNEEKPVGIYEVIWNAANLPSGVYFYRIQAGDFVQTRKMILLK